MREVKIFYIKVFVLVVFLAIGIYFKISGFSIVRELKNNFMLKKNKSNVDVSSESLPSFDLTFFYKDIGDEKINVDVDDIGNKILEFKQKYKNLSSLNRKQFYQSIKDYEYICYKITLLNLYAYLLISVDSGNDDNNKFYSKTLDRTSKWQSDINFYSLEIANLSDQKIKYFLSDKNIVFYSSFIDKIVKYRDHRLSGELERFSIEKNGSTNAVVLKYYDNKLSSLRFKFKDKEYNLSEIFEFFNSNDKNIRREAGAVFNNQLGKFIDEFTFVFNYFLKSKVVDDKWEKYNTPIDSELLANNMTMQDLDSMIGVVRKNFSNMNKYYKLKAQMLKLDKLSYFDRNVAIVNNSDKYNWIETQEIVLNAYQNFNPRMAEMAKFFFVNKRIDAGVKKSKRSGGFCTSGESFVFMNFLEDLNSVTTLAHELGHGIQMTLSKDRYGVLMNYAPLNLSEVASTFGEALVYNHLLESTQNNMTKIAILSKKIEGAIGTILRQTSFHIFEKEIHERIKDHELTAKEISDIWIKTIKESLGDAFEINDEIANTWSYVMHFIHHPFYVYSYAFSDMITYSLYSKYKQLSSDIERENFSNQYIEFITDMPVVKYNELLQRFNLNVDEGLWQSAIDEIIRDINSLEDLMRKEKLI